MKIVKAYRNDKEIGIIEIYQSFVLFVSLIIPSLSYYFLPVKHKYKTNSNCFSLLIYVIYIFKAYDLCPFCADIAGP